MDKFLDKATTMLVEKLTPILVAQVPVVIQAVSALIPVAAAAVAKAMAEQMNLPTLPDLDNLTEDVRKGISDILPEGINIPILGDILGGFFGGHK